METVAIQERSEFALWAIQRAQEIVTQQGATLAIAARDMDEAQLAQAATDLGSAISGALLDVFDGLMTQE